MKIFSEADVLNLIGTPELRIDVLEKLYYSSEILILCDVFYWRK
jgi:hypothetical protein